MLSSVPEGMSATRSYENIDAAVDSCGMPRIYNGFHFRSGVEIGTEMGRDATTLRTYRPVDA
jgi:hypothetical protein